MTPRASAMVLNPTQIERDSRGPIVNFSEPLLLESPAREHALGTFRHVSFGEAVVNPPLTQAAQEEPVEILGVIFVQGANP